MGMQDEWHDDMVMCWQSWLLKDVWVSDELLESILR
jgi:hypothetical protein